MYRGFLKDFRRCPLNHAKSSLLGFCCCFSLSFFLLSTNSVGIELNLISFLNIFFNSKIISHCYGERKYRALVWVSMAFIKSKMTKTLLTKVHILLFRQCRTKLNEIKIQNRYLLITIAIYYLLNEIIFTLLH